MKVLIIINYKKKFIFTAFIILFWISMILIAGNLPRSPLVSRITSNEYMSFSCPSDFDVSVFNLKEHSSEVYAKLDQSFFRPDESGYSSYHSQNGKFSFSYPSSFSLSQQSFPGSEILYHIDFNSKDKNAHGFVQVWNMPHSLKEFLDSAKASSQQTFKSFKSSLVNINGLPGYLWDYSVLGGDRKYYKGMEVFLKKENNMYRISYFVPEELWNPKQSEIFWNIVNSLKINI